MFQWYKSKASFSPQPHAWCFCVCIRRTTSTPFFRINTLDQSILWISKVPRGWLLIVFCAVIRSKPPPWLTLDPLSPWLHIYEAMDKVKAWLKLIEYQAKPMWNPFYYQKLAAVRLTPAKDKVHKVIKYTAGKCSTGGIIQLGHLFAHFCRGRTANMAMIRKPAGDVMDTAFYILAPTTTQTLREKALTNLNVTVYIKDELG